MNHEEMLRDIDDLAGNDFTHDMEAKLIGYFDPKETKEVYSQEDAACMAQLLSKIYAVAHQIHCSPCAERGKYNLAK